MNVNIGEKIEDNDVYYSLIEIKGDNGINIEDIKASLREAIRFYGVNKYSSHRKDNADVIHTEF